MNSEFHFKISLRSKKISELILLKNLSHGFGLIEILLSVFLMVSLATAVTSFVLYQKKNVIEIEDRNQKTWTEFRVSKLMRHEQICTPTLKGLAYPQNTSTTPVARIKNDSDGDGVDDPEEIFFEKGASYGGKWISNVLLEDMYLELPAQDLVEGFSNNSCSSLQVSRIRNQTIPIPMFIERSSQRSLSFTFFLDVTVGPNYSCAVRMGGVVYCWGNFSEDSTTQLPPVLGSEVARGTKRPQEITRVSTFVQVSAGTNHACALVAGGGIYCWGDGAHGKLGNGSEIESIIPSGGGVNFIQVSSGKEYSCGLKTTGWVFCWGLRRNTLITNPTAAGNVTRPRQVSGLTDIKAISAGANHACALQTTGQVFCWGEGGQGQLGNGTSTSSWSAAVRAGSNITDFTEISAGEDFTCGVRASGEAWCWGENAKGQLGNGSTTSTNVPTAVQAPSGIINSFIKISAGTAHTCAIRVNGDGYCWGENANGQLGNGTQIGSRFPSLVSSQSSFLKIAAGETHTCGLRVTGDIFCWGDGTRGQLGDNTTISPQKKPVPIDTSQVSGIDNSKKVISAAFAHNCSLKANGEIICWGRGGQGQLGSGEKPTYKGDPTQVLGAKPFRQVSSSGLQNCGVDIKGTAVCWGDGGYGQLGRGGTEDSLVPLRINHSAQGFIKVAMGDKHGCALRFNGEAFCWGKNSRGQLGNNSTTDSNTPVRVSGNEQFIDISAGYAHTCAINVSGVAFCWGGNAILSGGNLYQPGRLGIGLGTSNGIISQVSIPTRVVNESNFKQISAGQGHTCALKSTGQVWCWGWRASAGVLGDSADITTGGSSVPVLVLRRNNFKQIDVGRNITCGLEGQGQVFCWGAGINFQGAHRGTGTADSQPTPLLIRNLNQTVSVSAGYDHMCAVQINGESFCWGDGAQGRLGDGIEATADRRFPDTNKSTLDELPRPLDITASGGRSTFSLGATHTCGLGVSGKPYCWGETSFSRLGNPLILNLQTEPRAIPELANFSNISVGTNHTCGIDAVRQVWCWGKPGFGRLGRGSVPEENSVNDQIPQPVSGGEGFILVSVGDNYSCGLKTSGEAWCWGEGSYGKLGNGGSSNSSVPVQVTDISDFAQISAGTGHVCALRNNSRIYCWGRNNVGNLGTGTSSHGVFNRPLPADTIGRFTQISVGAEHSCAIQRDSTAWCWGKNNKSQLGIGGTQSQYSPVKVDGLTNLIQISAGYAHTCAIQQTGTELVETLDEGSVSVNYGKALCWGNGTRGQLGNNVLVSKAIVPQEVSNITDFTEVLAGKNYTCGVQVSGKIWCWGLNDHGQLGVGGNYTGAEPIKRVPSALIGDRRAVTLNKISTGSHHTCVVNFDGIVYCWGGNSHKQLGRGENSISPVDQKKHIRVQDVENAIAVYSGGDFSCALTQERQAWCWGNNDSEVLGRPTNSPDNSSSTGVPLTVNSTSVNNNPLANVLELAVGPKHICAVIGVGVESSLIRCWGDGLLGKLGTGSTSSNVFLQQVKISASEDLENYFGISAGGKHTCALSSDGSTVCWGSNEFGQLGNGSTHSHNVFAGRVSVRPLTKLVAGEGHTCGLGINQKVYCWGKNDQGQLGNGTLVDANTPQTVLVRAESNTRPSEILTDVIDIASGKNHVCATDRFSKIRCWGKNNSRQLGFINPLRLVTAERETSLPNAILDGAIHQITSSGTSDHTCFTAGSQNDRTTQLFCWGKNDQGQVGDLRDQDVPFPKQIISRCTEFPLYFVTLLKGGVEKKQVSKNRQLISVSLDSNNNIETCLSSLPDKNVSGKGCFQTNSFISGFTSEGEPVCSSGRATP